MTYQNFFLTAGISAAKGLKVNNRFTKYNQPTRILKIWMANQRNAKKKTIASKIAELTHTSKKTAIKDFNILINFIDDGTVSEMGLSEQELEYFYEKKQEVKNQLLSAINK